MICFGIENDVEMHLEFHIDLDSDSVSFEACLGSPLVQFLNPLGGLGGSLGRQRESEEGAKRGLGAKVAPSRLWDFIFEDLGRSGTCLGTLFGRSWEILGAPSGSQRGSTRVPNETLASKSL